jgi:cytochrome c oxidase subunit II
VPESNHIVRIAAFWALVTAIVVALLAFVVPIPGPRLSVAGINEHYTTGLLFFTGAPIFTFVCVLFVYEIIVFRQRPGDSTDTPYATPPATGNMRVLFWWCAVSLTTVFFLAGWGIFTLSDVSDAAGPNPMPIQVIAQQWAFTYRYPSYGGVESRVLHVPVDRPIRFQVTSIDVVHDYWIYQEDVKIDAVPGVTTYANLLTHHLGTEQVVCDELCGIWHGYMRNPMYVDKQADFNKWIAQQKKVILPIAKQLPPYGSVYYPGSAYASGPQNSSE